MERLAKHPEVGGYGEVLLKGVEGWSDWPPGAADRPFYTTYLKDRDVSVAGPQLSAHLHLFRYLNYLYEPRRDLSAIGFKLMYDQALRYPGLFAYLPARRVRVLHLVRRNLLDVFLSREAMRHRTYAHARSPDEREVIRLNVDVVRLIPALRRLERQQRLATALLRAMPLAVHEVAYEDLLADDAHLRRALQFLGVSTSSTTDLTAVMLKLAPPSRQDGIANFEEVEACLARTRFARLLPI